MPYGILRTSLLCQVNNPQYVYSHRARLRRNYCCHNASRQLTDAWRFVCSALRFEISGISGLQAAIFSTPDKVSAGRCQLRNPHISGFVSIERVRYSYQASLTNRWKIQLKALPGLRDPRAAHYCLGNPAVVAPARPEGSFASRFLCDLGTF